MSNETLNITAMIEDFPEIRPGAKADGTPFKRIAYKIKGLKMSVFDNVLPNYEDFTKGSIVDVEYTIDGKYNNIQKMTISNSMPPETSQPAAQPESAERLPSARMDFEKDKEASIVAQVIIKASAELISSGKVPGGHIDNTARQLTTIYKETKAELLS
jgi:hypothetical protein